MQTKCGNILQLDATKILRFLEAALRLVRIEGLVFLRLSDDIITRKSITIIHWVAIQGEKLRKITRFTDRNEAPPLRTL